MATKNTDTAAAPTYAFGKGTVPKQTSGRAAEDTIFKGMFPTPDGETITVTLTGKIDARDAEIRNLTNHARREAARLETPMSAFVTPTNENGERGHGKTQTVVHIYTGPKIKGRGRKPADHAE